MRRAGLRRGLCALATAVAAIALLAPCVAADPALDRVRRTGQLRVGIDATYPPFGMAEGSEFSGFDVDIARVIARELGVRVELINASFDGVFPALQQGTFDLVISAVTITPERSQTLLFSDPYIAAGQQVVVRADSPIETAADLQGRLVGVQINTTAQFAMEKRPDVRLAKYNTVDLALLDLQHGRVDAVASDGPVLRYMIARSFPGLRTAGAEYTDERFGIVLARGSDDLRRAVNAALWKVQDSGEYARVHARWFGESDASAGPRATAAPSGGFDTQLVAGAWRLFVRGVWLTATLAVTSLALGLPIGLALALARVPPRGWLAVPAATYVEVMRGTPLLVQILFIYFVLPGIGVRLPALASGVIALTLNAAAYISEVFRAGILSIDGGQMEAARALGMSHWQAMRRVVLPQTFRRVVPPVTNEGIALLKDSSLVSVIGLTELARTGQELASRHAAPLTIWPVVALLYLVLTFPLTRVAERLERRWRPVARG
jgi:His/Glu/Gln/Arg/opine family amino acid ABC transporter permease subunit